LHALQVPDAWSKLNQSVISTINIGQNQLEGPLPISLKTLEQRMEYLYLDNNAQLSGCVPLSPFTTISVTGTKVTGRCTGGSRADAIHRQQKEAMNSNFLQLLQVNVNAEFFSMLRDVLNEIDKTLGSSVQPGQISKTFQQNHPQGEQRGYCKVSVSLVDGIEYISAIEVGVTNYAYSAAGLNLRWLPPLLRQLPQLKAFECVKCDMSSKGRNQIANQLPAQLPEIAPNFTRLALTGCGLVGTLPPAYGNWLGLQELFLFGNSLTGSLPAELSKLRRLQVLDLRFNRFSGKW
jgi:hypothetical protein